MTPTPRLPFTRTSGRRSHRSQLRRDAGGPTVGKWRGFHKWCCPKNGWFYFLENPNLEWMMTGGSPISGNPNIMLHGVFDGDSPMFYGVFDGKRFHRKFPHGLVLSFWRDTHCLNFCDIPIAMLDDRKVETGDFGTWTSWPLEQMPKQLFLFLLPGCQRWCFSCNFQGFQLFCLFCGLL